MFKRILCFFILIIVVSNFIGCSKTKEYHSTTNQDVIRELINSPSQSYRFKLEQNKRRPSPVQKVEKVSNNQNTFDMDTLIKNIEAQVESSKHIEVEHATPCRHDGIYGIIITVPDLLIITIVSAVILIFFIFYRNKVSKKHNEIKWRV